MNDFFTVVWELRFWILLATIVLLAALLAEKSIQVRELLDERTQLARENRELRARLRDPWIQRRAARVIRGPVVRR